MYKLSTYLSESDSGLAAYPLFGPSDRAFEKQASASLLPPTLRYISAIKPRAGSQYVLVSAMGAGEFYGSNVNGDHFEEAGLNHEPEGWTNDPLLDRERGKAWTYGHPTFYAAHPYAHHRNKDASRAYGEVEFSIWNAHMRRVELVTRVDRDKCDKFGGMGVWDRLKAGQFPDVSMGAKVCYDLSSITTDWDEYQKALKTFDPKKFAYPGLAVVEYHNRLKRERGRGIRGLAITRADYDEWTLNRMNQILPDGRKVFVYNPYPRFFDISFVFIGADRTAKVMVYIVRAGDSRYVSGAEAGEKIAEQQFYTPFEKVASAEDHVLATSFAPKQAALKQGEIEKETPGLGDAKGTPLPNDATLPDWAIRALTQGSLSRALTTAGGLGIVLKPQEFQKMLLLRAGQPGLAQSLDDRGELFGPTSETRDLGMNASDFAPMLARLLSGLMPSRSGFAPYLEGRFILQVKQASSPTSLSALDLSNIGAAYNGYRTGLMNMMESLPSLYGRIGDPQKLASASADLWLTPLSRRYFAEAFFGALPARNG